MPRVHTFIRSIILLFLFFSKFVTLHCTEWQLSVYMQLSLQSTAVSVKNGPFVIARVDAMVPSLLDGIVLVTVQFSRFSISSGRDSLFESVRHF